MKQEKPLPHSVEEALLLLRFPKELREQLDLKQQANPGKRQKPNGNETKQPAQPHPHGSSPSGKTSKTTRWLALLCLLMVTFFGFSLWSLEQGFRKHQLRNPDKADPEIAQLKKSLSLGEKPSLYRSTSSYLKHHDLLLRKLKQLHKEFCDPVAIKLSEKHKSTGSPPPPPSVRRLLLSSQTDIGRRWQKYYRLWRNYLLPPAKETQKVFVGYTVNICVYVIQQIISIFS